MKPEKKENSVAMFESYIEKQNLVKEIPYPKEGVEVSVVIPAFNEEDTLLRTLEAFTSQTSNKFELIVVDNNSTDKTAEIIKNFIDKNPSIPVYYLFQPIKGVGYARKMGMDQVILRSKYGTKLKYILCTDGDTVVPDNWVESILETAKTHNNPEIIAGEQSYYNDIDDEDLHFIDSAKRYLSRNFITQTLGSNLVISTEAYVSIDGIKQPYNEDGTFAAGEDVNMVTDVKKKGGRVALSKVCVFMDPRRYLVNLIQGDQAKNSVYGKTFDDIRDSSLLTEKVKSIPKEYIVLFKNRLMRSQFKRHVVGIYYDPKLNPKLWKKAKSLIVPLDGELENDLSQTTTPDIDSLWVKYREAFYLNLRKVI